MKNISQIYSKKNTVDGALYSVVVGMRTYSFTTKRIHHNFFPIKFVKSYITSFLQSIAWRLLLIPGNISNASLAFKIYISSVTASCLEILETAVCKLSTVRSTVSDQKIFKVNWKINTVEGNILWLRST